jgi:hypothetical protein
MIQFDLLAVRLPHLIQSCISIGSSNLDLWTPLSRWSVFPCRYTAAVRAAPAGTATTVSRLKKEVDELKARRKATQRHIAYKDLRADAGFDRLSTQSKHPVDTIKMIAYRAETAMAQIVRQTMSRHHDARSLLRAVYSTEVDLIPDQEAKTLTVRVHPLANASSDQALKDLCAEINATETQFPGTELRLIYESVSAQSP